MEMYLELVSLKPALPLVAQTTILFSYFLRQKRNTNQIQTETIKTWDNELVEKLTGGIELTDWDVFFKNNDSDLNLLADSVYSHLIFCTDSFILSKQVVPK